MGTGTIQRDVASSDDHSSEVIIKNQVVVTSRVVQRLGLWASTAGDGFDPGQKTKILHAR